MYAHKYEYIDTHVDIHVHRNKHKYKYMHMLKDTQTHAK